MNKLKINIVFYFFICLSTSAIGQISVDCISKICDNKNDSIFRNISDYSFNILKFKGANHLINSYEIKADSMTKIIQLSSLPKKQQQIFSDLIHLTINESSGDTYSRARILGKSLVIKFNKYIPLASIYEMDREYCKQNLIKKEFNSWASAICNFIINEPIYYDSTQTKVTDTTFTSEIKLYQFNKGDVIADIGAGSGKFERVLSRNCDHLTVFATEIDSANLAKLATKLKFLEIYDQKNITYTAILGNEKSTCLPSDKFDKIIIKNAFHHFSYPNEMLKDCKKNLKRNGKLFIVDILIDEVDKAPGCNLHLSRNVFLKYLNENGFVLMNEKNLGYGQFKCFEFQLEH